MKNIELKKDILFFGKLKKKTMIKSMKMNFFKKIFEKGLQRGGIDDIIDEHSRERATGTLKTEQ